MNPEVTDQELPVRLRQQQIISTIGAMALQGGFLGELLQEATRLVADGLGVSFCMVMELRPAEQNFLIRAGVGWRDGVVGVERVGLGCASPAGCALTTGREVISNALASDSRFNTPLLLLEHGMQRAIDVVIRRNHHVFGVLEACSQDEGPFTPNDLWFVQGVANLLGMAIGRKLIENELAHSHARINEVLESISDAFYSVDHEWRFIYFNRNAEVLWRRRRSEVLGTPYQEEFPSALGTVIHDAHLRAARERRVLNVEALSPALNRWLDVTVVPSADGLSVYMRDVSDRRQSETGLQALAAELEERVEARTRELAAANARLVGEIAERKRAESALMQGQRLEAIGQLTGGIAHDFNNLLTAVIGNLELLQRALTSERAQQQAQAALAAAQRGGTLTRQLLAYARKQHVEPRPMYVNATVRGMLEMLRRSLGGLVTIETALDDCHWAAMADPVQVESVVLNLAINARDAMPNGGTVCISTRDVPADSQDLPRELERQDYVMVAVADQGTGMSPEVAARAFEPFFTTKEVGQGSGLGLAQVHGVATQFGGTARVHSVLGEGTTVEVYLPRAPAEAPAVATEESSEPNLPTGETLRVLVVDDQDDVRAIAAAFLEEAGFAVDQRGSGAEALTALADEHYHLALVDHGMAGMSGIEFVRRARETCPALRVIYVTGHAEPLDAAGVDPGDTVLTKPYEPGDLLSAVRRRLAAPA